MKYRLALDPGEVTGFAWGLKVSEKHALLVSETGVIPLGYDGMYDWMKGQEKFIKKYVEVIIAESFKQDGRTRKPNLTPLEIQSGLGYLLREWEIPLVLQSNKFKAHVPDALLKKKDLWVIGSEVDWEDGRDANDATKHLLAHAKTTGDLPTQKEFWGK